MLFDLPFPFLHSRAQIYLDNFINNPQGKGSSYGGRRKSIKEDLAARYTNILQKNNGELLYKIFYNEKTKNYFFYFKIPSETFEKFYYDVVLEFVPDNKEAETNSTIYEYSMNFFSNSPHMMMTYTYVLNKNKVIVEFLKPKYSKRALTQAPVLTNPVEQFGFEKSCYYAALYIRDKKMYIKEWIKDNSLPFDSSNKIKLLDSIMSQDQKFAQYQELKRKADLKKREERNAKVKAHNTKEYNRVKKLMDEKRTVNKASKKQKFNSNFKSTTARHKPFKSLINKK